MDHSPKIQRLRSYGCTPLDVGNWCHSRRVRTAGFARAFENGGCEEDDEFEPTCYQQAGRAPAAAAAAGARFRGLWRRIVREKRRIMRPPGNHAQRGAAYDEYTYAQNFDEGSAWDDDVEPENLPRSFSARFAVPSRAFQRSRVGRSDELS